MWDGLRERVAVMTGASGGTGEVTSI